MALRQQNGWFMNNFKFWVPIDLVKSGDGKNAKMKLKGIASTADVDSDNEILLPSGFDLSYFKEKGFVNWHHGAKTNPDAIIGEPTKAEITNNGLYVECELYNKPLAKSVFELAEVLENQSNTRKLGFSIEGQAIERDSNDPRKVTKAKITGLAVTHMPKNSKTLAEVMKGEQVDHWIWDEEVTMKEDLELLKSQGKSNRCWEGYEPVAGKKPYSEGSCKKISKAGEETYNDYPESAVNAAKKAIKYKEEHGDEVKGGTQVGWTRANQIANRENLSKETVVRIYRFKRHEKNAAVDPKYKDTPWKDNGHIAWLIWGGKSMIDWAEKKYNQMQKEEREDIEKTLSSGNASAIMPESVEGVKTTTFEEDDIKITKGMVIQKIFEEFSDISISKANKIYNLIEKTASTMGKTISQQTIDKAFAILGLSKAEEANQDNSGKIEFSYKAMKKGGVDYYRKMKGEDYADNKMYMKKGDMYKTIDQMSEEDMKGIGCDMGKAYKACKSLGLDYNTKAYEKAMGGKDVEDSGEDMNDDEVEKSEEKDVNEADEDMNDDEVTKALNLLLKKNDELEKSLSYAKSSNDELFKAVGTVVQGLKETIDAQTKQIDDLNKAINELGNQPFPKKSISSMSQIDRWLEKGGGEQGVTQLNATNDRHQLLQVLEGLTFKGDGIDDFFAKAMTTFESSGHLSQEAKMKLYNEHKIAVV